MDGKNVLVLSDSHGDIFALEAVLKWAKAYPEKIEAAFFLGDGLSDISRAEAHLGFSFNWHTIRGNNDFNFSIPDSSVFEFCGHRFLLCHGHRYSIYSGFHTLIAAARSLEAGIALFGHTHVPHCKTENGILLVNPGSIGRPRSRIGATFAIIKCTPEKTPEPRFFCIGPNEKIDEIQLK